MAVVFRYGSRSEMSGRAMDWSAIPITDVVNGAMVIVMLIFAWVARTFGAKAKSNQPAEQMELAGAIIDKTQAQRLEAAFIEHTEALEALGKHVTENTNALKRSGGELADLGRDIRELTQEVIRNGRG
ncbi:hypothetical protein L1787_00210 [Acuticoccus sp. M5D2P5]|uniref:hypothetical protein n=1 Tax=Acuticoccus kalidii TaxID=2910977 RepID=UPI001F477248|nr:hypothetical protein [Acuticoccus kalidii]MCF3931833.1 hypothetical protein [Acuticoccus kalidii]